MNRLRRVAIAALSLMGATLLGGCHVDMWRQPKLLPQHETTFFQDGSASRPPVPNTIARGQLREDEVFFTGVRGGELVTVPPIPVTADNLARGEKLFGIHCAPCHGPLGYGNGMISQRGLALRRKPANYHTERLRNMPIGYFYDVMTNGAGVMYSAAGRVAPEDRWRIAMHIRVLQLSQNASLKDVPPAEAGALGPVEGSSAQGKGGTP